MGEAFELLLGEVGLPCDVYSLDALGGCGMGFQQQQWPVRIPGFWKLRREEKKKTGREGGKRCLCVGFGRVEEVKGRVWGWDIVGEEGLWLGKKVH